MNDSLRETPRFTEDQRMRQKWLWGLIIFSTIVVWYALVRLVLVDIPDGSASAVPWWLVALLVLIGIGLPLMLGYARLRVAVFDDRIEIHYRPFTRKTIMISEIEKAYAREYRPIGEYGGWGVRFGFAGGRAYNAYGNRGVQLELKSGKKVLIGSQRAEELAEAIVRSPVIAR